MISAAKPSEITQMVRSVAIVGGLMATLAVPIFGLRAGLSVLLGTAIGALNLFALGRIIKALVPSDEAPGFVAATPGESPAAAELRPVDPGSKRSAAGWSVLAVLKIGALFGGVWLLWRSGWVAPLPMVMGYGALPLGLTLGSLLPKRNG
jgi:hypothetical protein